MRPIVKAIEGFPTPSPPRLTHASLAGSRRVGNPRRAHRLGAHQNNGRPRPGARRRLVVPADPAKLLALLEREPNAALSACHAFPL